MIDLEKLQLRELMGHFTLQQLWALAAALVALLTATFLSGTWIATQTHSFEFAELRSKNLQIMVKREDEHRAELNKLDRQLREKTAQIQTLEKRTEILLLPLTRAANTKQRSAQSWHG